MQIFESKFLELSEDVQKQSHMDWNFKRRTYWDGLLKSLRHASFPAYSPYGNKFILDQV